MPPEAQPILEWIVCFAPVAVLFVGITFVRAKIPAAAGTGLIVSLAAAAIIGGIGEGRVLEGAETGISSALSILYAVWPAMFLYDILRESGAFETLRTFAQSLTQDMLALVLLFAWVFSSFLQSITGFGVPVAVCAPFLVALGIRPVPAVIMTLIGHSWGNTFGTLGMAWGALVQMGPVENTGATALFAGGLLWVVNLSGGMIVTGIYGGRRALRHGLPLILLMSIIMGGGQTAVSLVDTTVACFLPSTIALVAFALLIKFGFYKKPWHCVSRVAEIAPAAIRSDDARSGDAGNQEEATVLNRKDEPQAGASPHPTAQLRHEGAIRQSGCAPSLHEAALYASPFAFLVAISLVIFVVPGVRESVSTVQVGGIQIVGHAGFALLASCLFASIVMTRANRLDARKRIDACREALGRLWSASAGIILLVIMARVMQTTGQMQILAEGVASATGSAYFPFAPALGTFGAFITSSNMSSNILLAGFQHAMANSLGGNPALLLAAQTAGGAAGAAIGPSTILLGAATVGATGREGEMLKPLLAVSFAQAAVLGIIAWAISAA